MKTETHAMRKAKRLIGFSLVEKGCDAMDAGTGRHAILQVAGLAEQRQSESTAVDEEGGHGCVVVGVGHRECTTRTASEKNDLAVGGPRGHAAEPWTS